MARRRRVLEPNRVYHVYNRRTDRQRLFPSPQAYDAFLDPFQEGVERYNIRICAYCLMETHWHQAIWVRETGATPVANFLRRLCGSHASSFRRTSGTRGNGHVYQARYKAKVVESDKHYLTVVRYIEANPVAAGLVRRAEHWPWSSLGERLRGGRRILHDGPAPLPERWVDIVNSPLGTELPAGDGASGVSPGTELRGGDGAAYNPLL
jgi:putative transposase